MRFLSLYRPGGPERTTPPGPEDMAKVGGLIEEMMKEGTLLATEGCQPTATGARVGLSKGKYTVIDGPFTETKELVAGFALLRADSKDEAIKLAKRFLDVMGHGECEIRPLYDACEPAAALPGNQARR